MDSLVPSAKSGLRLGRSGEDFSLDPRPINHRLLDDRATILGPDPVRAGRVWRDCREGRWRPNQTGRDSRRGESVVFDSAKLPRLQFLLLRINKFGQFQLRMIPEAGP